MRLSITYLMLIALGMAIMGTARAELSLGRRGLRGYIGSLSSNWNGDYGYKQLSPTTSVNAPIIGSRAIAMPGYPQFTTASGAFPVAPARPVPPTFFPGLYGTFTSPIQSAINRAAAGRKRQ